MKANRALREGEPDYNLAEELISAISHGLGALFGVAALVLGLLAAAAAFGLQYYIYTYVFVDILSDFGIFMNTFCCTPARPSTIRCA